MQLFDVHCHVPESGIDSMLERAAEAGVVGMAVCGTSPDDWSRVFQTLENYPQVFPMTGIHPWFVSEHWKENFQTLEKTVREFPKVGIGETGLDFQERFTNRAEQEASFAAHLDLARELKRTVAVHCVHARGRLIEILKEHPAPRVLLHAFSGAPELIPELVELNCWFSFCGSVTNPAAKRVRASAAAVPAERLLIETDSPDFPPAGCEMPNEPANLIHVARVVAGLRGVPVETIAEQTFSNAMELFDTI
ncbi:MAG: TatD family hydrolase [Kiritimatiellales bacterium]